MDIGLWFLDQLNWLRRRLSAVVCFFLGHLDVDLKAVRSIERSMYRRGVEGVCLRCGKQYKGMTELMDQFFERSPLAKRLEKKP